MTPDEARAFIAERRERLRPDRIVYARDIQEVCDLAVSLADDLDQAHATIKDIPVVTVVGGEACKECREHAVWEMELSAERLAALEALVSDLESPHPSAWYSRERILLKIKRMREELTKAANAGRIEP